MSNLAQLRAGQEAFMNIKMKKIIRVIAVFLMLEMVCSCILPHLQLRRDEEMVMAEAAEPTPTPSLDATMVGQYVLNVGSNFYKNGEEVVITQNTTLQLMYVDAGGNPKPITVASGSSMDISWVSVDDGSKESTVFKVTGADKTGNGIKSFCDLEILGLGFNNLSVEIKATSPDGTSTIKYTWKLFVELAIDINNIGIRESTKDETYNGQYGLRLGQNTDKQKDTLQIFSEGTVTPEEEKYTKYLLMLKRADLLYSYVDDFGNKRELNNFSTEEDVEQDAHLKTMLSEKIIWTSSNSDVAEVKYGVITGKHAGTAIITATTRSADQVSERSISIKVVVVPRAQVNGEEDGKWKSEFSEVVKGSSFTINTNAVAASDLVWTVRSKNKDGKILWSNESAITTNLFKAEPYDTSGEIYFSKVKAGTYYITARVSSQYGETNTSIKKLAITIVVPVSVNTDIIYMNVGDTYNIIDNSTLPGTRWYTYTSNKERIATVSNKSVIKATGTGTAKITLNRVTNGAYKDVFDEKDYDKYIPEKIELTVIVIDSILINYTSATIYIGSTLDMKAETTNSNIVEWTTSDEKVATVDEDGVVTGIKEGTAIITATQIVNGVIKTASCHLTVRQGVTEVTLEPAEKEMAIGDNLTINAKVKPNMNGVSLKWVSSNDKIVTVLTSGDLSATVKAVGPGEAVISAVNQENVIVGFCMITVYEPITKITLSPTEVKAPVADGWIQLHATIEPKAATEQKVVWTSTNPSVATVDEKGIVTYKKPGQTTIIVTSRTDATISAMCHVEVLKSVTGIKLDKTTHDMFVGETFRLTYKITPDGVSNGAVTWSSSNSSVVSVDQSGMLSARGVGTAVVMVKTKDGGYTAICTVNVGRVATAIKLDVTKLVLNAGEYYYLEATLTPADSTEKTVTYESSDTKVAVVSKKGKVTAKKAGACVIMAKTKSGSMAYCAVTVMQGVTGVELSDDVLEIAVGEEYEMDYEVLPKTATNKNVKWKSSNKSVFTVDEEGELQGVAGGVAVLTCTTEEGGYMDFCVVTVIEEVTTVKLDKNFYKLGLNATYQFTVTVSGETASNKDLIWSSSDPDIVSVDDKGRMKGLQLGYATITCEAADGSGASDICEVRVCKLVTDIQLDVTYITLIQGKSYALKATVSPDDATYDEPLWTSDDPEIAIVSTKGVITALTPGNTMIHATANDSGEVSAICYVNVIKPVAATSISVSESEIVMSPGEQRTVAVALVPNNSTENITWSSDNTAVATVDSESGQITANAIGSANINILTESGRKGTIKVFVVGLSRSYVELQQYTNLLLKLEVDGSGSQNFSVRWDVDNQHIATVVNGRVTAKALGTTTVYAVVNGRRLSCVVKVVKIK